MKHLIFEARNGIHVIDLSKTLPQLEAALEFLTQTTSKGGLICSSAPRNRPRKP